MKLTIDFETRSAITELGRTGPWPYAEHPSTDVICLAMKWGDEKPGIYVPDKFRSLIPEARGFGLPLIELDTVEKLTHLADEIEAHNVQFEMAVWFHIMHRRYGLSNLPLMKLRDSAAKAAMHALPRKLEDACKAMNLDVQKDMDGNRLMLKLCKPRSPRKAELAEMPDFLREAYASAKSDKLKALCAAACGRWEASAAHMLWNEDHEDIARVCEYCLQDVEAEHALSAVLEDLPPRELAVFRADLISNTRGVGVDVPMVDAALDIVASYEEMLLGEMDALTSGMVKSPKQVAAARQWLLSQGVDIPDMKAATVKEALAGELPDNARRLLEIRQSLSKSSTAKYSAAKNMAGSDGRMRGIVMYHGAATGRWTGKGIQLQNLPRGVFDLGKDSSAASFWDAVERVRNRDLTGLMLEYGDPMPVLSSTIRPLIKARPGHEFLAADYSAIEGRGLAWLAGEEWVLDAYQKYDKGEGPDMYMVTAGKILGKPGEEVTKSERKSPGKIADLACGYFGGPGAIAAFGGKCPDADRPRVMADIMRQNIEVADTQTRDGFEQYLAAGLTELRIRELETHGWEIPTEEDIFDYWAREVVTKWRESRPLTKALWVGLEEAAVKTVDTGQPHTYGRITYRMERDFLTCELPSGRKLYYPFPKLVQRKMTWGQVKTQLSHMTVDSTTKQWVRRFAHGGVLTENCLTGDTLVITSKGVVPLTEVKPGDSVWDGESFVPTDGPVEKGVQEVGEWLGIQVTQDHLIHDGSSWKPVIELDEKSTLDSLRWARSSVLSQSQTQSHLTTDGLFAFVPVDESWKSRIEGCTEEGQQGAGCAGIRAEQLKRGPRTPYERSSQTTRSEVFGPTGTQGLSAGVTTQTIRHSQTMEGEGLGCLSTGSTIEESSCGTQRHSKTGTNPDLNSPGSTIVKGIAPEISTLSRQRKTQTTGETQPFLNTVEKKSLLQNSGKHFALGGKAGTQSPTTSRKGKHQNRLWKSTGKAEPVFDLLNCGPNHRFAVMTNEGPVVVHNCVQALCRDILAEAIIRLEKAGFPIVLHVHDEVVAEVPKGERTLEEFEEILVQVPQWADNFPISAAGWVGERYRKD